MREDDVLIRGFDHGLICKRHHHGTTPAPGKASRKDFAGLGGGGASTTDGWRLSRLTARSAVPSILTKAARSIAATPLVRAAKRASSATATSSAARTTSVSCFSVIRWRPPRP